LKNANRVGASAPAFFCEICKTMNDRWHDKIEQIINSKLNKGVYQLTNNLNGKVYVGQSSNLRRRIYLHLYNCNKFCNNYDASKAPISLFRVGIDNISIEVKAFVEDEFLRKMIECQMIQLYSSVGLSLNQRYSIKGF